MANLVFRKIGYNINGGDPLWLRDTPASTISTNEFFGAPSGNTVLGYIKYWTGASWAIKAVKYWNGTSWIQKPLKYWNGSSWLATEYSI